MIYISKDERTPEYFGMIARMNGQTIKHNPYGGKDGRIVKWLTGFWSGELIEEIK